MVVEAPVLNTQVDDPSHPLHHHRRIVTDFEYGDILGEGSYSTVCVCITIIILFLFFVGTCW
jgi:hypothetical protein